MAFVRLPTLEPGRGELNTITEPVELGMFRI